MCSRSITNVAVAKPFLLIVAHSAHPAFHGTSLLSTAISEHAPTSYELPKMTVLNPPPTARQKESQSRKVISILQRLNGLLKAVTAIVAVPPSPTRLEFIKFRTTNEKTSLMPLHTYTYLCGHARRFQGRECSCFYNEVLRINDRHVFSSTRYLPFSASDSCRHDKRVFKRYECNDCVWAKSREQWYKHFARHQSREKRWKPWGGGS